MPNEFKLNDEMTNNHALKGDLRGILALYAIKSGLSPMELEIMEPDDFQETQDRLYQEHVKGFVTGDRKLSELQRDLHSLDRQAASDFDQLLSAYELPGLTHIDRNTAAEITLFGYDSVCPQSGAGGYGDLFDQETFASVMEHSSDINLITGKQVTDAPIDSRSEEPLSLCVGLACALSNKRIDELLDTDPAELRSIGKDVSRFIAEHPVTSKDPEVNAKGFAAYGEMIPKMEELIGKTPLPRLDPNSFSMSAKDVTLASRISATASGFSTIMSSGVGRHPELMTAAYGSRENFQNHRDDIRQWSRIPSVMSTGFAVKSEDPKHLKEACAGLAYMRCHHDLFQEATNGHTVREGGNLFFNKMKERLIGATSPMRGLYSSLDLDTHAKLTQNHLMENQISTSGLPALEPHKIPGSAFRLPKVPFETIDNMYKVPLNTEFDTKCAVSEYMRHEHRDYPDIVTSLKDSLRQVHDELKAADPSSLWSSKNFKAAKKDFEALEKFCQDLPSSPTTEQMFELRQKLDKVSVSSKTYADIKRANNPKKDIEHQRIGVMDHIHSMSEDIFKRTSMVINDKKEFWAHEATNQFIDSIRQKAITDHDPIRIAATSNPEFIKQCQNQIRKTDTFQGLADMDFSALSNKDLMKSTFEGISAELTSVNPNMRKERAAAAQQVKTNAVKQEGPHIQQPGL